MGDLLYLIVGIAAVGLVTTRSRRRRRVEAPPEPTAGADVISAPTTETAPEAPVVEAPPLEKPESTKTRMVRLRQRLAGTQGALGRGLLALLSRDRLDEDTWESVEDTLLGADLGVAPTQEVVERLRTRLRVEGGEVADAREVLREGLLALIDPKMDRRLQISGAATTGQNGMVQAKVFSEVVDVTGIVLTKLDGSAKGGIVVAVQRELGVPVKLVGLGEGPDDLAPFEPKALVDALLG
jgi:fused signal recognition particle receptor